MKTNPLTSRLRNLYLYLGKHRKMSGCAPTRRGFLFSIVAILLFFLLLSLVACKTPATLTNDTQHRTRDSTYHATVQRIETHDTIIIGPLKTLSNSPLKGEYSSLPLREGQGGSLEGQVLLRISDRTITLHDTVYICRTDTLLRTQTITKPQKYIPPFYRFCTISFVTFVSFVTLTFSIHLLLRYLKIRSPSI